MQRLVTGAGSLLLRGLGPSGLLITRGLGGPFTIEVVVPQRPRNLRKRGTGNNWVLRTVFVRASLVVVNDVELVDPPTGSIRIDFDEFNVIHVVSILPSIQRRIASLAITARFKGRRDIVVQYDGGRVTIGYDRPGLDGRTDE